MLYHGHTHERSHSGPRVGLASKAFGWLNPKASAVKQLSKSHQSQSEPDEHVLRKFKIGKTTINAEDPPWDTPVDPSNAITVAQFRDMQMGGQKHGEALWENADELRLSVWGLIKMAEFGLPEETLFKSEGHGKTFALVPAPRSPVPLQWAYYGPGTIPNSLADTPCASLTVETLLDKLNEVLGTNYTLKKRGLQQCLEHFLAASCDFGQVYGVLRGYWKEDFHTLLAHLAERRDEEEAKRREAMQDHYISNSNAPRRRMWDLYSNRVLPAHVVPKPSHTLMTRERMAVSHSWVHDDALKHVWTPINGNEWPVPIPHDTTLEHVRVELLNLGAEYVWLDVLCLRQRGRPEDDAVRQEEWKVDVPTIGNIYRGALVVTYFNGLGLPLDPSPETLASDRHWLNRVWTVQEATKYWLPGGITGDDSPAARTFFRTLAARAVPLDSKARWPFALQALRGRACTTELDRVHGLAYSLFAGTLPVYDEGLAPADAWTALLKHIHPAQRMELALRQMANRPDDPALLPTWDDFLTEGMRMPKWSAAWDWPWLYTLGKDTLGTAAPGTYFQREGNSFGPAIIVRRTKDASGANEVVELESTTETRERCTLTCQVSGALAADTPYIVMKTSREYWLVAQVVGERQVQQKTALEVVKRGCFSFTGDPSKIPEEYGVNVVYISEDEARKRGL